MVVDAWLAGMVVAVEGVIAAAALFPIGLFTTLSGTMVPLGSGIVRILTAAAMVGASLFGLAAVGLLISTRNDVPVGATAALAIRSGGVHAVPALHAQHPWLFTHWWLSSGALSRAPIRWTDIERDLGPQAVDVGIFAGANWLLHHRSGAGVNPNKDRSHRGAATTSSLETCGQALRGPFSGQAACR